MYNKTLKELDVDVDYIENSYNENKKYLVKGRTIYQVCYSENAGWYTIRLWCKAPGGVPLVHPGHYIMAGAKLVNQLAGFPLVVDDK